MTVRLDGGAPSRGRTSNLSRGGLCAVVGAPVAIGAAVDVELALVFDKDTYSEPLTLPARIVWCTDLGGRWQLGVSFRGLGSDRIAYLELFLKFLKDGRSARAQTERSEDSEDDGDDLFGH